jgi:hypothetical protein
VRRPKDFGGCDRDAMICEHRVGEWLESSALSVSCNFVETVSSAEVRLLFYWHRVTNDILVQGGIDIYRRQVIPSSQTTLKRIVRALPLPQSSVSDLTKRNRESRVHDKARLRTVFE